MVPLSQSLEPKDAETCRRHDRQKAAELIRDHGKTLLAQAKAAKLDMLAYLLELAIVEAEETVSRLRSEEQTRKNPRTHS